jgi:hypothetical protein
VKADARACERSAGTGASRHFPSIKNRLQLKLMPAGAGVVGELIPEIMEFAATMGPGKSKRGF